MARRSYHQKDEGMFRLGRRANTVGRHGSRAKQRDGAMMVWFESHEERRIGSVRNPRLIGIGATWTQVVIREHDKYLILGGMEFSKMRRANEIGGRCVCARLRAKVRVLSVAEPRTPQPSKVDATGVEDWSRSGSAGRVKQLKCTNEMVFEWTGLKNPVENVQPGFASRPRKGMFKGHASLQATVLRMVHGQRESKGGMR
ncbi:hypothetical protein FB45DRAFT_864579 [Roridomyces roridus]|uniref:Uncharacterized protein n=1 Tax=Roridomyces roridus TaxID=1738132 RepID=A0AAD7C358_9AGAR|nr:hypothetical protein FB45DRAFT_864579 [Roridomyces roridus]